MRMRREEVAGTRLVSVIFEYGIEYEQAARRWELRNRRSTVQPSGQDLHGRKCEACNGCERFSLSCVR
jgi:hypothetical protein